MKRYLGAALLIAAAACAKKPQAPSVQTAVVTRRDIIIDAQANGVIEPIAIIEVKSKAGGVITQMPVETGTHVNPGDLIVQIDTRDVQNKYDQQKANLDAAETKLSVTENDKKRQEEMFKARIITPQEFDNVAVQYETAKSAVIGARTNLDIAKQALEDATVKAPASGTIIDKTVSVGTVLAGATNSVSGGTTIVKMANLTVVRVRALFNESDIGNVHPGQAVNVTVDAYPDRRFTGLVEKIEPQAVVQQNVTMFPVLVNLENGEALLRPGMNGSVAVLIDEHDGVLAVPNDAIKNPREAVATGAMLGLAADSVTKILAAQGYSSGPTRGGFGGGNPGGGRRGGGRTGGNGGGGAGNSGSGGGNGAAPTSGSGGPSASATGTAGGEVAITQQSQGNQGFGGQQVSDADCKAITAILAKNPADKKQLDDLYAKMMANRPAGGFNRNGGNAGGGNNAAGGDTARRGRRGGGDSTQRQNRQPGDTTQRRAGAGGGRGAGNPDMQAIQAIYTKLGIDPRNAGACRRQQSAQANGGQTGAANRQAGQGGGRGGQLTPSPEMGGRPQRTRQGLVFVSDSSKTHFEPRVVQLGAGNLDFTEVASGVKEGERVVMLGALALQAQRQQQLDRSRQNASPLGGATPGGPGPGGGGPGPGGGGPGRGGGGGGRGG